MNLDVDEQTYAVLVRTAVSRGTDPAEVVRFLLGLSPARPARTGCGPTGDPDPLGEPV